MERQLWKLIVGVLGEIGKPRNDPRRTFALVTIAKVWFWAVIHDRPISWACRRENWPIHERRWRLPSNSTMSRRMRSEEVKKFLEQVEQRVLRPTPASNQMWYIDGKPLPISGCSKDNQSTYGRAAGGKAKGYKLHAIIGADGSVAAWNLASMKIDEREIARRLLPSAPIQGYIIADSNYDSNKLFGICDQRGDVQMIAPRRYGKGKGLGHRRQTPGRLRSKMILEDLEPWFAEAIMNERVAIERYFGNLTNWGGGLNGLPAWARTYHRVRRWVQAKMILSALKPRNR